MTSAAPSAALASPKPSPAQRAARTRATTRKAAVRALRVLYRYRASVERDASAVVRRDYGMMVGCTAIVWPSGGVEFVADDGRTHGRVVDPDAHDEATWVDAHEYHHAAGRVYRSPDDHIAEAAETEEREHPDIGAGAHIRRATRTIKVSAAMVREALPRE
jgi:hypothetical protein